MDLKRAHFGGYIFEEVYAVRRFLETADRLGLPTPINYEHFEHQKEVYRQLWDSMNYPDPDISRPFPDPELYPAFALAQHYGVPTRFLDWTESPLVAAFFAAHGMWDTMRDEAAKPASRQRSVPTHFAVIPMTTNFIEAKGISLVHAPRVGNEFLCAQQGLFTLIPDANSRWWDDGRWPSLHDMDTGRFCPQVLPRSEAVPLLRLLFQLDITPYHLKPTLQNAADAVRYKKEVFAEEAAGIHNRFDEKP